MTRNSKENKPSISYKKHSSPPISSPIENEAIAIIGIGCRFPGEADSPQAFWQMLCDGVDAISEVPADRWNANTFYDPDRGKPGKIHTRWGGFIKDIDKFDAHFFGISPREATRMDPQQRLLLEVAWEALEDAGQAPEELAGSNSGVFIGISAHDYLDIQFNYSERDLINSHTNLGGAMSIAANRISYVLNFRGPSMSVDTACSSSLVAVHLACQSIWNGESTLALAGGVHAILKPEMTIGFSKASMLSPNGRCFSFDARANGYVRAEGAGIVVLKPLSKAVADGDPIVAVIRNTAVNQDGRTKGITVPNGSSQMAILRQAYQKVGIAPSDVQYIEAHGTGTPVGDPIEVKALGQVLSQKREPGDYCLIGSVKSNIGHLEAGSGIAGLIKAALCLKHGQVPPNLHFETPNPDIPFEELQLRVPQRLQSFPNGKGPRIAGVNSFGFGGTNAHVVLQEAPETRRHFLPSEAPPEELKHAAYLLPLSARTFDALQAVVQRQRDFFHQDSETSLSDICLSASLRRGHHNHRLAVVAASKSEMAEHLDAFLAGESRLGISSARARPREFKLVFVFSGMGQQWWAMGRELWHEEPLFREVIEQCDELLRPYTGWSLQEELLADEATSRITETHIAQPALFALQVALAALWRSWGIEPDAVVGHSVGEVAAAHVAGALSLQDAIQVIFHRSRLQAKTAGQGKMLALGLSEEEAKQQLIGFERRVSIAAINSPRAVTLSGDAEALEQIANSLEPDVFRRLLQVEVPYHSPKMELIKAELLSSLQSIKPQPATTPLFSTVTGQLSRGPEWDATYWWQNVRNPVRFAEACDSLMEAGFDIFLEVGAHPVLAHSMKECLAQADKKATVLPSLRRKKAERVMMLASFGKLYTLGYPVDWNRLYAPAACGFLRLRGDAGGRFVRLPSYPWQQERYWNESETSQEARLVDEQQRAMLGQQVHPLLGAKLQSAHPVWDVEIDTQQLSYLSDHAIQGSVVYPAAAYVEMALAAAPGSIVEEIEFDKALFLPSGSVRVQFVLHHDHSFDIYSGSKQEWVRHAHGNLIRRNSQRAPSEQAAKTTVALDEIRQRLSDELTGEECYQQLSAMGLEYGPTFQGIERLWRGQTEALGAIAARKRKKPQAAVEVGNTQLSEYHLHPTVLDACFQVLLGVMASEENKTLYLPVGIKRLRVQSEIPSGSFFCHAQLREQSATVLSGDIKLFDEGGNLLVEIQGLRCNRLAGQTNVKSKTDDYLYQYEWEASTPPDLAVAMGAVNTQRARYLERKNESGSWLIFADSQGLGGQLAERLYAYGESPIIISPSERFERLTSSHVKIRSDHASDYQQLVFDADQPLRGVVHLWSLDMAEVSDSTFMQEQSMPSVSVLHLVQALSQMRETPRTFLVTRGVQPIGQRAISVAQSPLWGLGRVIMNEQPQLRCTLVDLTSPDLSTPVARSTIAEEIQALFNELLSDHNEDEIAFRGPTRYVHRLRKAPLVNQSRQKGPFYLDPSGVGIDNLLFRAATRRKPAAGEVEIEIYATGLNFKDVAKAMGLLDNARLEKTFSGRTLGLECAGKIAAVGAGVEEFKVGDEVFGLASNSFATYTITDARFVKHKPERFSFEEAATTPIVFLTAYYALHELCRLRAGERILIHSATGGVGLAALQLAQKVGAQVFATAGNPQKRALLRDLGVKWVMDSRSLAFADEVMAYTNGEGIDLVLNTLPGETITSSLSLLRAAGRFIDISNIYSDSKVGLRAFGQGLSFFAFDLDQLMRSRPDLIGYLFNEAMEYLSDNGINPLPHRVFPISEAMEAFRYMAQAKHIGKIALSFPYDAAVEQETEMVIAANLETPIRFDAQSAYLITGGLGGFGLATAKWMVEHGARHLVLMGRSRPSQQAQVTIEAMEEAGAEVKIARADVTEEKQVARVLANISPERPLRGIIHAANVYDDAVLLQLNQERFQKVMAPKVIGAWNLHTETLKLNTPLDFFLLFSSITSLVGNPGQGNYVAANAFLDAFAHYRHAQGLPALSINWGAVADVGVVAENHDVGQHLKRIGIHPLPTQKLFDMLGQLLKVDVVQRAVVAVEWSKWASSHSAGTSPRFSDLVSAHRATVEETRESEQDVESTLREEVARILGTSPTKVDISEPLSNMGLDSLMAVDLTNRLKSKLDVDVPTMKLLGGVSVAELSAELVVRLADSPEKAQTKEAQRENQETSVMNETTHEFYPKGTLSTLIDLLRWRAEELPNQRAYTFLVDGETEEIHLTYAELDRQARAIAARLQDLGMAGERALLLYHSSLEFITAFFACLYAGVVAVPTYPPRYRHNRPDTRFQAIAADSQAKIALTTTQIHSEIMRQHTPTLAIGQWLTTNNLDTNLASTWQKPAISDDSLAFLQYTSGSTGTPKGVMVTHRNLLHNERMIKKAFEHTEKTVFVGWLPLFHDMGLIGNVLQPIYLGITCILMSPMAFIQKPVRWLQAISRYKATTSGGPNFAYDLCVRKITPAQQATLDLSSWKVAFNGSEPVRAETLQQFAAKFESSGFRREAFYPCYGMAEATLLVSGGPVTAPPTLDLVNGASLIENRVVRKEEADARAIVGCGHSWLEQKIIIVDPDSCTPCAEGQVGEIWVSGHNVAQGYWNRPQKTAETFQAYLADGQTGPFLRTGDLGYLRERELFITGRLKDMIIIDGRNHYPQDIELTVEKCDFALRSSGSAAFSIKVKGKERLVVVAEVRGARDLKKINRAIRRVVTQEHELRIHDLLLAKPGTVPKTSSGKRARHACRAKYLAGTLNLWER